jgi:hypothetical protein
VFMDEAVQMLLEGNCFQLHSEAALQSDISTEMKFAGKTACSRLEESCGQ